MISSLLGTRIIHASVGPGQTVLVSDGGKVYAFGRNCFWEPKHQGNEPVTTPRLIDSLSGTYIVQATVGYQFTAMLTREGKVYTFFWGDEEKLCHDCDTNDLKPRLLRGPLENRLVAQISAGHCYLLSLVWQPTGGMSVYSVGCGAGGKLGNGQVMKQKQPVLIEEFSRWVSSRWLWPPAIGTQQQWGGTDGPANGGGATRAAWATATNISKRHLKSWRCLAALGRFMSPPGNVRPLWSQKMATCTLSALPFHPISESRKQLMESLFVSRARDKTEGCRREDHPSESLEILESSCSIRSHSCSGTIGQGLFLWYSS